jgi:hypothetical protein
MFKDLAAAEVVVEAPTITVAYNAPGLVPVLGEISELDQDEFVTYQGKPHMVVMNDKNDKEHQQLVIQPYG